MDEEDAPFVSPALAQFLAGRVHEVMATQSYAQHKWTRRRIASYITGSEEIAGTLSDATLGRFLDPAHPQKAQPATVAAVQNFLMHFRYITSAQVDWVEETFSIRSGLALEAFFDVPRTRTQSEFLAELEGEYRATERREPFILHTRLHLVFLREVGLLTATEVLTLYRHAPSSVGVLPETLAGKAFEDTLDARFVATGQVLASANLVAIFLKASAGRIGFDSIVNVSVMMEDEDGSTETLKASRNLGWKSLASKTFDKPVLPRPDMPSRQTMKLLSNDPQYSRLGPTENVAPEEGGEAQSPRGPKSFHDTGRMRGELTGEIIEQLWAKAGSAEERLRIAREYGSLPHFKQALAEGAEPNVIAGGSLDSYIMEFAKNGDLAWAQAILADPRCRIEVDARGMTPSFYTGLLLRHIAGASGTDDLCEEWGELYRLLLRHEQEQGCYMRPGPHEPTPG